jgi:arylsulfatase A-like enzyme
MAEVFKSEYQNPRKGQRLSRELKALYLNNYKYIREYIRDSKGGEELYDIETDPLEMKNLATSMPDKAKEMEMKLRKWLPHDELQTFDNKPLEIDQATQEALEALGYIQDNNGVGANNSW